MTDVLRGRLRTLYAAMKKGQLDFVLNAIHDDIEFISYSPIKVFPFLGHRRCPRPCGAPPRRSNLSPASRFQS